MSTAVARRNRQDTSSTRERVGLFRGLSVLTAVATYLLIVLGGTVRATGSGLGCPDWPTCQGRLIPSFNEHVLIEYSHRLSTSLVSLLVVLLAVVALWYRPQPRHVKALAGAAVALLVAQVVLGAITVKAELPPQVVTAHLATATTLLGVLVTIAVYAYRGRPVERDAVNKRFARAAMMAAAGAFLLILSGSYVVGSDAGLACHTWPLCNGQVIPSGGLRAVEINVLHRVVALLVGLGIAAIAARAWRTRRDEPALLWASTAALIVYLIQALVGAGNVWFNLAAGIRIAHLAAGEALWVVTVILVILAATVPASAPPWQAQEYLRRQVPAPGSNRRARFGDRGPAARGAEVRGENR